MLFHWFRSLTNICVCNVYVCAMCMSGKKTKETIPLSFVGRNKWFFIETIQQPATTIPYEMFYDNRKILFSSILISSGCQFLSLCQISFIFILFHCRYNKSCNCSMKSKPIYSISYILKCMLIVWKSVNKCTEYLICVFWCIKYILSLKFNVEHERNGSQLLLKIKMARNIC